MLQTLISLVTLSALAGFEPHWSKNKLRYYNHPFYNLIYKSRAALKNMSIEEATADLLGEKQPSKKFTTPEQIGEMVAFLSSPSASNITGSEFKMDGAWTTQ